MSSLLSALLLLLALCCGAPAHAQQTLEAIVVRPAPLLVKTLDGALLQFAPWQGDASMLRVGDLVRLTRTPGDPGTLLAVERAGATLVGTVSAIADDNSWLIVRSRQPDAPQNDLNVPLQADLSFAALLALMRPGDGVRATFADAGSEAQSGPRRLRALEWQYQPVPRWQRWLALLAAALLLLGVALVLTGMHPGRLILGLDNRYSSSQLQSVLWFWVVISAYLAIISHRIAAAGWTYVGGVDIPPNLLLLSGVSVLSFASAKLIARSKAGGVPTDIAAQPRSADLIQDDRQRTDLGDFQMVVITLLAVLIYAISAVEFMERIQFRRVVTMPDVDATLLAIFSLGQAAYLGKKAAGQPAQGD